MKQQKWNKTNDKCSGGEDSSSHQLGYISCVIHGSFKTWCPLRHKLPPLCILFSIRFCCVLSNLGKTNKQQKWCNNHFSLVFLDNPHCLFASFPTDDASHLTRALNLLPVWRTYVYTRIGRPERRVATCCEWIWKNSLQHKQTVQQLQPRPSLPRCMFALGY